MSNLTTAIRIAAEAHDGQVDKAGEPYILHPLRVMLSLADEEARIVGVLHDVAEDAEGGWQDIHDGDFSATVLDALDAVTRREGESYGHFIERCAVNDLARAVKLADIADNLSEMRRASLPEHLRRRYESAFARLSQGGSAQKRPATSQEGDE